MLYTMLFVIIAIIILFQFFKSSITRFMSDLSHRCHAFTSYCLSATHNRAVHEYKIKLFSRLNDDILKSDGDIMEIGCGSGGSLAYFPKNMTVKLSALEPNSYCKYFLEKNLREHSHVKLVKFIENKAEDMKDVSSNSVSLVLSTIVLCSVENQEAVLREVIRILKPGGKFYFLEHVVSKENQMIRFLQNVLHIIWRICFDGCNINCDTIKPLKKANFKSIYIEEFNANFSFLVIIKPHIWGYAEK